MSLQNIFFDLDHTLWDFDRNCSETLSELYYKYRFDAYEKFTVEEFVNTYRKINVEMWHSYHSGLINKDEIRNKRFIYTFDKLGLNYKYVPEGINEDFLRICPGKTYLIPYTHEVLSYLKAKYNLYILTNGFLETQNIKIDSTNIRQYFKEIINSESCGYLKPDKRIFHHAINTAQSQCDNCLMVGDDLHADIKGAKNAGLDVVYFNREKLPHNEDLKYEIHCLSDLMNIL